VVNSGKRPSTPLGYALLGLVYREPASGYDLCRLFETTPMAHYSSSPGAIYPALRRLEKQGLIAGETEKADSLRPRRVYRSTAAGEAALREWASAPVTRDDVVRALDLLMLRFALMGALVDRAASRRFLEELSGELRAYLVELEGHLEKVAAAGDPHGRLALESGIEQHRVLARWARRALSELTG
jgi:DNA-binding PadR family transcriptional regulator